MVYEEGVINEVRALLQLPLSKTVRQVHGLADIEQYLTGKASLKEMMEAWQQRVRNYARRQLTWFRHTRHIHWVDIADGEHPWETAARIRELIRNDRAPSSAVPSSSL